MATGTLRPSSDVAFPAGWAGNGTGTENWDRIDDDPDSSDNTNSIQATGTGSNVAAIFGLTDTPADFGKMTTVSLRTYSSCSGWVDDTLTVVAGVYTSAGTALASATLFGNGIYAAQIRDLALTLSGTGTSALKADWDAAELRFTHTHTGNMSTDSTNVLIYAAELNLTYVDYPGVPTLVAPTDTSTTSDTTPSLDFVSTASTGTTIVYQLEVASTNAWSAADTTAVYYMDGHSLIADPGSQWTNDANAFNGNTTDSAHCNAMLNNALRGYGTNAPNSPFPKITSWRFRAYGITNINDARIISSHDATPDSVGSGEVTLDQANLATTLGWSGYAPVRGPRMGNATGARMYFAYLRDKVGHWTHSGSAGVTCDLYRTEFEVTYNPETLINATSDLDSAEFVNTVTGGDTSPFNQNELIRWTMPYTGGFAAPDTYYWRVRARNSAGGASDWTAWSSTWSFTLAVAGDVVTRQLPTFTLTAVPGTITAGPATFNAQQAVLTNTAVAGTRVPGTATVTAQTATYTLTPVAGTTSISVSFPAQVATFAITPQVGVVTGGPTSKAAQIATYTITPVVGATTGGPVTQTGVLTSLAITPQVGTIQLGTVTKAAQIATYAITPVVGLTVLGPVSVTALTQALALTAVPGAAVVEGAIVNAQVPAFALAPQLGVVSSALTLAAQVATFTVTPQVGIVTGGPVSVTAQVATTYTITPQIGVVTGGPVTKTAQIATATLTTLVGTVTGGPVTKTAQIVTVALTTLVGTVIPGTATVNAQLATLTILPLAGSSGGNIGVSAQVAPLTLAPTGGALAVAQTVTAQTAPVALTPTSGVVVAGAVTKTAQIGTVTLGLGVTALTPGLLTQAAQIASLAVTPGSTAFAAGTIQPSTISTVSLVAVPGSVIGGPVTKSATTCSVTLTPTPGFFILGTVTVAAARASASLTGSAGALAVGTLTVNGTTTTLALTGISGGSTGTLTQTASVANFTFTARTGTTIGGPTTKSSTTVTLALTPRANQMQLGNQTWAGTKGTLVLIGDSGDFDALGVVFAGWGVPIA